MQNQQLAIEPESIDNVTEEDMQEIEDIVDEYTELIEDFNEDLDDIMRRINESNVYQEMGVELHVSVEYLYSYDEN